ncbi:MAG TPA: nucleotide sugar dehydrogenase [Chloroflexia bacterium]|nr:nucleotide sugar dehydrogenase [Chloroflexia bacterium]
MLIDKIKSKHAKIGVIGMGYVGLPVAVAFAEKGFRVTGFDVVKARVSQLNRGESYIGDIPSERLLPLNASGCFHATYDFSVLAAQDVIIIAVPTPLNQTRDPDLTAIKAATRNIAAYLQKGQLVVLESTTYPGTTEEVLQPILEEKGFKVGQDFYLAFSPERIDPGSNSSKGWCFENTPKVVGGVTPACLEAATSLYGQVIEKVVPVSSARVAEMCKLFENTFRVVNVALVNEMALLCDRMGLNVWEVLDAASTKPYGFMKFTPGPGVGGHCIPVDPFYLTWKAREFDFNTRFIELAGEINLQMPRYVRELVMRALNTHGKSLKGSRVLLLGVAYKKDVADMRETPAIRVIELLEKDGAQVSYHDPHVPQFEENHLKMSSIELSAEALAEADCVVLVTDHSAYDYNFIVSNARLLVDTRNATLNVNEGREKITLL